MAEISATARELARRALLDTGGGQREPAALAEAADHAYVRLRDRLADLIGVLGYGALVARAMRMVQAESPGLTRVTVDAQAEDRLQGLRAFALASRGDPVAAAEDLAAILAHIIGLLVVFIGEDLAVRLVHEASGTGRAKSSPTAHLSTGFWGQRRRAAHENSASPPLPHSHAA